MRTAIATCVLFCIPGAPGMNGEVHAAGDALDAARDFREREGARILRDYAELLAIPNVASDSVNIRRNAQAIHDAFEARGATMEIAELPGAAPLVHGRLEAPGAERTLGIYVHYDGQPVDESKWAQSPWQATLYTRALEDGGTPRPFPEPGEPIDPEWRLYARASGDDKAPFPALFAALDALQEAGIERTSNLVFLFEGEEEAGSDSLGAYMDRLRDELAADVWLILDGPVHQSRKPQLVFGVRGFSSLEITVYGAARNLHSGHYGNWAPNPAMMLAQLLATMKDENGRVTIEGFYDDTEPPGPEERAALATVPAVDEDLKRELGLARTEGDAPLTERLLLPSLNVRGLAAAGVGDRARNVIPNEAIASIDVRLVKGNDPARMLDVIEAHVREQGYHVVREGPDPQTRLAHPKIAKIRRNPGYRAARTAMNHPIVEPLRQSAERASGERVIRMPSLGGSLPLYLFEEKLGAPVVIVPIANHDDNQHAPNENLRLANLWYGIDLMAEILTLP